ncbi:MAG: peptidoglycan DD-metalloendopeptidase family protein [Bacteroidetes bacterium]|nr:peptidoglycan DD-metalloendopeptidase family protein [Bacteroidota bacterium]
MSLFRFKSKISGLLWGLCFFMIGTYYSPAFGQTKTKQSQKELQDKTKKLNEDIKQLNSQLSHTKQVKKSQINTIVVINTKLKVREELIGTINAELTQVNREIKQNQVEIDMLKAKLDKLKQEYAKMIYFAQRNQESYTKLMFIFASGNFNQAYMRLKYFQQYTEFRKKQAMEIMVTQNLILEKLQELEARRHEKNVLLGNEQEEKSILDKEKQEQESVLGEIQAKEKELKAQLEQKKRDAENLQLAIKKLIADEIKRKAEEAATAAAAKAAKENKIKTNKANKTNKTNETKPEAKVFVPELTAEAEATGNDFASSRGKLPWPVAKGVICQGYGEYEHPAIKGFIMYNNGVEICVTKGTQARAVFEGEVTSIAISPTGGKLVIIRHGEYLSVYSNLGDVFVKQGDKVTIKQAIGTIIEDDGKTSMNLQIWKGNKTMDPGGWLFNGR